MRRALAHVIAVGLACPVGLYSRAALAAMRAGVVRFMEVDEVDSVDSARASMLASLPRGSTRTERAAMFARAVREALSGFDEPGARSLPCFLALPEPAVGARIDVEALTRALEAPVPLHVARVLEDGRAGIFAALEAALAVLARGEERFVLVAGVDSLVDPQTLGELAESGRLLGPSNLDGIIPGEGAACVLLCDPNRTPRRQVFAQIVAAAVAREPLPVHAASDRISPAEGLSAVFGALRGDGDGRVDQVFAGTTGQSFFGREFTRAYLQNEALMPEPLRCEQLSHALGDVGAAAGAISLVQAIASLSTLRTSLAYASSDNGLVGGCVVTRPR
jgi:3-oxoacyl-[acyl-carrier-protein] synthase-1